MSRCAVVGCYAQAALAPMVPFCTYHTIAIAIAGGMMGQNPFRVRTTQSAPRVEIPRSAPRAARVEHTPKPRKPNYYRVLGVRRDAAPDEVKKAYRKKALRFHPDRRGGSSEKMAVINEAYSVLSNAQKRAEYDAAG